MVMSYSNVLSDDYINYIKNLPEVQHAKSTINSMSHGSIYLESQLTTDIKNQLSTILGINLENIDKIPMRWVKGDTLPHEDIGTSIFNNTYLVYLNDSEGNLKIGEDLYDITKGVAYVFNEGIIHETINTGLEPRLLIGPMNENAKSVGIGGIAGDGGTVIYIRQNESDIQFNSDLENAEGWSNLPLPCTVTNTNPTLGMLKILFTTNISVTNYYQYFICAAVGEGTGNNIQFGSESLNTDGSRPIITINILDSELSYAGFIHNGDEFNNGFNNVFVFNLKMVITDGILSDGGGWVCARYFGYNASNNIVINCTSNGLISPNGGGIMGEYAGYNGELYIIGCSSTGNIGQDGGGICGSNSGNNSIFECVSCWSEGNISDRGGGILGANAINNTYIAYVQNCYSLGTIGDDDSDSESLGGAGGILGANACISADSESESEYIVISNCYSAGSINKNSGGIIGMNYQGPITIYNCYSTGPINSIFGGGGICGNYGDFEGTLRVTNCYVSSSTNAQNGYIISTSDTVNGELLEGNIVLSNNYSEASNEETGWNSENANTVLLGNPGSNKVGSVWCEVFNGEPYLLKLMGHTPFSRQIITINNMKVSFNQSYPLFAAAGYPEKDMAIDLYTNEFNPYTYQTELFPNQSDFIEENIELGDKSEETRLLATYWNDLGDDVFDDWGYFYLYDSTNGKYYFPIFNYRNTPNGQINTQTYEFLGRIFTINYGWSATGIFKIDISVNDELPFRFGAYGNMGSDGDEEYTDLTTIYFLNNLPKILYYRKDAEEEDDVEILYTYFNPHNELDNTTKPYNVYYDSDDYMHMVTTDITIGISIYFTKTLPVNEWIINDIKCDAGYGAYRILPGASTSAAIVTDREYQILQITGGDPNSYDTFTINSTTGVISTTINTVRDTYKLYIYNTGSYNITEYTITINSPEINPCLTEDTIVLTPSGYKLISKLSKNSPVVVSDGRIVKITNIYRNIVDGNKHTYPCIIPKNSISNNYPPYEFNISQNHLIKYKHFWVLPKEYFELNTSKTKIVYYHIQLPNYITDNLVINNGVIVESYNNRLWNNVAFNNEREHRLNKKNIKLIILKTNLNKYRKLKILNQIKSTKL